jgi:hypothetical protein
MAVILLWCATEARAAIQISPTVLPDWTVNMPYSQTLTATGCTVTCVWSASGQLPQGVSLSVVSGTISGIPTATGNFHFTVTATSLPNSGSQAYTITINPAPAVTTSSLANGQAGTQYSQTVAVTDGTPPYKFSVSSGSLPPGLSLDSSRGVVSGTPGRAGSFAFTVLVIDQAGASASHAYTLTITSGQSSTLTITTTAPLPGGSVGTTYSFTLAASGGNPPYSWALIGGALPGGLALNGTTGAIGGTPSAVGSFAFTVQVTDASHVNTSQPLSLAIASDSATPSMSLTGVPGSASSAQQISLDLVLSSAYSRNVTGTIALSFAPDGAASNDDPSIQFSSGGRSAAFTIPAGGTHATFPISPMAFQTGTVSGTISLAVNSSLPGGSLTRTLVVARSVPVIQSATVVKGASGFQVQVIGFSNTRELTTATFHFTAASGQTVQTADFPVSLSGAASQWFAAGSSAQFGGQVLIVTPFTVQQGSQSGLTSVTVSLQNSQGGSPAITANF